MYPTPPSHENNAVLSPMTSVEATTETTAIEGTSFTIKTESLVGTLTEELSKVCPTSTGLDIKIFSVRLSIFSCP